MTSDADLQATGEGAGLAISAPVIGFVGGFVWEMDDVPALVWLVPLGAAAAWTAALLGLLLDGRRALGERARVAAGMGAILACAAVLGAFTLFALALEGRDIDAYGGHGRSWESALIERSAVGSAIGATFGVIAALTSHVATRLVARPHVPPGQSR